MTRLCPVFVDVDAGTLALSTLHSLPARPPRPVAPGALGATLPTATHVVLHPAAASNGGMSLGMRVWQASGAFPRHYAGARVEGAAELPRLAKGHTDPGHFRRAPPMSRASQSPRGSGPIRSL